MSKSSDRISLSLGLGTIIFWAMVLYYIFGGSGEDKKQVDTKKYNKSITVEVQKHVNDVKEEANKIIVRAKEEFENIKKEKEILNKDEQNTKSDDKFGGEDIYKSSEDKW